MIPSMKDMYDLRREVKLYIQFGQLTQKMDGVWLT